MSELQHLRTIPIPKTIIPVLNVLMCQVLASNIKGTVLRCVGQFLPATLSPLEGRVRMCSILLRHVSYVLHHVLSTLSTRVPSIYCIKLKLLPKLAFLIILFYISLSLIINLVNNKYSKPFVLIISSNF